MTDVRAVYPPELAPFLNGLGQDRKAVLAELAFPRARRHQHQDQAVRTADVRQSELPAPTPHILLA